MIANIGVDIAERWPPQVWELREKMDTGGAAQAKIDALRAETKRRQQEILLHQQERQTMEHEMEAALGRYEDMVAEQEKATDAAIADGHLAPSIKVTKNHSSKIEVSH